MDATAKQNEKCIICCQEFEEKYQEYGNRQQVGEKGKKNLLHFAQLRCDDKIIKILETETAIFVHDKCRRNFTDKKRLRSITASDDSEKGGATKKWWRLHTAGFYWKRDCFFCGKSTNYDPKHPDRSTQVHEVTTLPYRKRILEACDKRSDSWAAEVKIRLHDCLDLVAVEAKYHSKCQLKFCCETSADTGFQPFLGRPTDAVMVEHFSVLCNWLENDGGSKLYTLAELRHKMIELTGSSNVYSDKRLKQKVELHYGNHIYFAELNGKQNVVCFRNMANYILHRTWYAERKENVEDEARRIVVAAAKLIRTQLQNTTYRADIYPNDEDI